MFSGPGDRVSCHGCGITLGDWHVWPNPKLRHRQTAPTCPLVSAFQNELDDNDDNISEASGATGYSGASSDSGIERDFHRPPARTGEQRMST